MQLVTDAKTVQTLQAEVSETRVEQQKTAYNAPAVNVDPLGQFKANIAQLERMQAKMTFMLHEVGSIIKK